MYNLKYQTIENNNHKTKNKRSISERNHLFTYENISNSFLIPDYSIEKYPSNYDLSKTNLNDFINGFKTLNDLRSPNKIKNDILLKTISPIISQRNNNSLEKSVRNINYIKKEITWEYRQKPMRRIFSKENELEKINKILDSNNGITINTNEIGNNNLKKSFLLYKDNKTLSPNLKYNGYLTSKGNTKTKNIFKENNKRKYKINNIKKFEFNKDYLKPFKKKKIIKRFPKDEVEEFTNGLMYSPYV
jgi:hypothetical protein